MAGAQLMAGVMEYRRAGIMYLVHEDGTVEPITGEQYCMRTAEQLRGCTMCVYPETAEAESLVRKRVRGTP